MPTARDALLSAAGDAVERRPWQMVRMIEVAAAAGVSRQTLYNEFGDKAGLGWALGEHRISAFLAGFEDLCAGGHDSIAQTLAAATGWIVNAAHGDIVVRASLTGCRCAALPPPVRQPGALVGELRDRAARALAPRTPAEDRRGLSGRCETAVRLAVSHLVAPGS